MPFRVVKRLGCGVFLTQIQNSELMNDEMERLLQLIASLETNIDFFTEILPELEKKHQALLDSLSDKPPTALLKPSFEVLKEQVDVMKQLRWKYLEELLQLVQNRGAVSSFART
jgi:hypothetical protein